MSDDGSAEMGRLARDIADMPIKLRPITKAIMQKTAADIQAGAQARAPVDTGALRNSISRETRDRGNEYAVEIGPTVNYAGYVEHGTSRQRAQPYLRPATDAALPGMTEALRQAGGEVL